MRIDLPLRPAGSAGMTAVRGSILLVDDEEKILKRLGRALRTTATTWSLAANAREAQRRLAERQFDLVVIDNLMPGMSGLDLVREVIHVAATSSGRSWC